MSKYPQKEHVWMKVIAIAGITALQPVAGFRCKLCDAVRYSWPSVADEGRDKYCQKPKGRK